MNKETKTTCPYCGVGCGVRALVDTAGAVTIRGDEDHPANFGRLCSKGTALADTLDLDERLLYPQVRGKRTDWNTALDQVARGFKNIIREFGPESVAFYVSGQLLTEDYYVANKLMKGYIGTANIDTNSRLCMSSAVVGHKRAFGEDAVPGCYEDLELANLIVLVGSNTAWCHPVVYQRIMAAKSKRPDMKIVVIDPRRTATCDEADLHLPIQPGRDVDLFNGLLAFLDNAGCVDRDFVANRTRGVGDAVYAARAGNASVEEVARVCGVSARALAAFYRMFVEHERTVTVFSQGVNQSSAGSDKVNAIINCHLLTGRIGKPGATPFSITGQPNAMGGREVGGLASTLAAHMGFERSDTVQRFWDSPVIADKPGLKAVELFEAIGDGRIKAVWIMATNPVVSLPNADAARAALEQCELVVVSDCMAATDTVACADIKLPALGWAEKDGTVTNSERRISRQRAFLPAPGEAKADWWIISEVARRMGFEDAFSYAGVNEIFAEHARLSAFENGEGGVGEARGVRREAVGEREALGVSGEAVRAFNIGGLAELSFDEYNTLAPIQWPLRSAPSPRPGGERAGVRGQVLSSSKVHPSPQSFPQPGRGGKARLFADGLFPTPDNKARFIAVTPRPPVNAPDESYPLILNSGRIRDHWHTMTRTAKSARLSGHIAEPFVEIHPQDAQVNELKNGALAKLETRWGKMLARVKIDENQHRGSVFTPIHWTGQYTGKGRVGALVNPVVDPDSGEPEFKHTPVRIKLFNAAWSGFLLSREPLKISTEAGLDYWTRIKGERFWRYEIAGRDQPGDWAPWARRVLGAAGPNADWLEYRDSRSGRYRVASLRDDRMHACLFVGPDPTALPARDWLTSLFVKEEIDQTDRMALLAGQPADPAADTGVQVCSCFGVGRNTLINAIKKQGLQSPEAVGQALKAGTNCGSCIPEIKTLLRQQ